MDENQLLIIICLIYSCLILGKGRQHQCQVYQLPAERSYLFSLQAVALVLAGMTALVAASGCIELPRDIDAYALRIAVRVNIPAIIQTIIVNRICLVCSENITSF